MSEPMITGETILVALRDPFSDHSKRTLKRANDRARSQEDSSLVILHVNRNHKFETMDTDDLDHIVSSVLDTDSYEVAIRYGYLVEREILDEAKQIDAHVIVIGRSEQTRLRRLVNRIIPVDPDIGRLVADRSASTVEIV